MSVRANRVGEQMKKELGEIIGRKIKDPRIGFVTVTDVQVTGDLQQATVYISVLGDEKQAGKYVNRACKGKGFIRSEIGQRIRLRKTPEIFLNLMNRLIMEIRLMSYSIKFIVKNKQKNRMNNFIPV